jgi:hypothetical protein
MPDAAPAARGVYKPRRSQASPLFRLVSDHLHRLQTVYDERFVREYGPWRPVVGQVTDKFLVCGVLDHGFARIRCDACAHEYLLAFSCKCRYFCPSCHAKRLAIWAQWLDATLLAPVPHRQVVLTIPKRLRADCLYRRRLLGEIARVAARTVTAAIRTLTGERELAVGIVACLQTHGSRANWHPHLHLLVTDGGFRTDGTFVSWPAHVTTRYYGWYANRPRGMRRQAEPVALEAPPVIIPAPRLAPTEATRRWAALLQQIFEVDPRACPTCHGAMRIVAFITQASVIDRILTHLRTRAATAAAASYPGARSPPSTRAPSAPGARR